MTKKLWIILTAVGCVLILAAGWFLLVSPQRATVASINADTANQQSQNDALRQKLAILKAGAAQVDAERNEIKQIQQQIPLTPKVPEVIRTLSQAATDAGVTLTLLTPNAPTALSPDGKVSFVALQMSVQGGYFALEQFLNNVEQLKRATLINGVAISSGGTTGAAGCPNAGPEDPCLTMPVQAKVFSGAAASAPAAPSGTSGVPGGSTGTPS